MTERVRSLAIRYGGLTALCAGLPAAETLVLINVGLRGSVSLAPAVTAAAPYGMYHDLRFLLTYHYSWATFMLEAAAMVLWRAALDGALVLLAWPTGLPRPGTGTIMKRTAAFASVCAALLTPSAATASAMAVMPVSDLLLGGMPVAVIIATITSHGAVTPWWQRRPPARAVAWSAATLGAVTVAGALMAAAPAWTAPLTAAGSGLFNAGAWAGIVRATAAERPARPFPLAPLAVVATAAAVIACIPVAMRLGAGAGHPSGQVAAQATTRQDPQVLYVGGFHSAWDGAEPWPLAPGLPVERFSYRGLDPAGRPLPYGPDLTQQSLHQTVRLLSRQVESVHQRTRREVAIVADSEGSLAVETYLAAAPGAPVGRIVLLDPLVDPGRAYFPPPHVQGWGVATGAILRGLGTAIGSATPLRIDADGPFIRSVDDHGPVLRDLLACPARHVRELVVFSLADEVASPFSVRIAPPSTVVPRLHGYLLTDSAAAQAIAEFLRGGRPPASQHGAAADLLVRAAAAAWQAPPLVPSLVPRWRGEPVAGCAAKQRALTAWLR